MAEKRYLFTPCLTPVREVFRTEAEVLMFAASGTGGMESAVANLFAPGDRVVVVCAGYFGERWAAIARAYGCNVDGLRDEWGATPSADDVAERAGGAKAVFLTHSET